MGRPAKRRRLAVWMNGERVGSWTTYPGRPDEFTYAEAWLTAAARRPISLSMPLGPTAYRGDSVASFFDNLLPDSRQIRERLQRRFSTTSMESFDLLVEIGRDCVGAIQLLPEDQAAPDVRSINATPVGPSEIESLLDGILAPTIGRGEVDLDFRISLAGAQEKTALLRHEERWCTPRGTTPSTHILKLPIGTGGNGIDLRSSVENEWLCAQILRACDVPTANCSIEQFGDRTVLVVERFDRRLSSDGSWIVRLPQEDLCQATGTPGIRKYEADGGPGIQRIMDVLLGSTNADQDRRDFFRTQILFWLLCAIDGHAKNFSLFLDAGGGYRLTPRYDVLSAYPVLGHARGQLAAEKVKLAMAFSGSRQHYLWNTVQPRHLEETARRCGFGARYHEVIEDIIERLPAAVSSVLTQLPSNFPCELADQIANGTMTQLGRLKSKAAA